MSIGSIGTVTIPKTEYAQLKRQATAYRTMAERLFESVARDPIEEVVADFRATGLYTDDFLSDLEDGLSRSSYVKSRV